MKLVAGKSALQDAKLGQRTKKAIIVKAEGKTKRKLKSAAVPILIFLSLFSDAVNSLTATTLYITVLFLSQILFHKLSCKRPLLRYFKLFSLTGEFTAFSLWFSFVPDLLSTKHWPLRLVGVCLGRIVL